MNYLSPSILAADFCNLKHDISKTLDGGAKYLHIDVMDGIFVPNISFGFTAVETLRKEFDCVLDVHLMITQPERYIERFAGCGSDIITFHLESTFEPSKVIELIHKCGKKAGISIRPGTDVKVTKKYLDVVDMVLIMTVEPGFGGQKFMPEMLDKIRYLSDYKKIHNLAFDIEVDGGITFDNVKLVVNAGANVVVAGSSIFGTQNILDSTKLFMNILCE